MNEIADKLRRVRQLLESAGLDGILLARTSNVAWLTGGCSDFVNVATDTGPASLLITADQQYVLLDNIEAPRFEAEEQLPELGFELQVAPWYEPNPALGRLTAHLRLGSDVPRPEAVDLAGDIRQLRLQLLPEEGDRLRECSHACAAAMAAAVARVRPGMTELQIAGLLAGETLARGPWPIVDLVATDERVYRFRHPLPTARRLERYAMLVLCGRWRGLVASITRLVHFGPLPAELQGKEQACAVVDATFLTRTRPGARVGDIFQAAVDAYAAVGYPQEWQQHHQGGPAGYEPREYLATPASTAVVQAGQAYAWNPSIAGVKSEDTMLVGPGGNEVLTAIATWPTLPVQAGGQEVLRPAILTVTA